MNDERFENELRRLYDTTPSRVDDERFVTELENRLARRHHIRLWVLGGFGVAGAFATLHALLQLQVLSLIPKLSAVFYDVEVGSSRWLMITAVAFALSALFNKFIARAN